MQTVGKTAEEIFRELMLYGNSYIPLPKGDVSMASAVSIRVEMDAALVARIRELEASNFELAKRLLESSERLIALTAERDALCVELDNERRRAEAAEDKFALVPVDGIAMIVRFLDDGAWDESKGEAVESWLNSLGD